MSGRWDLRSHRRRAWMFLSCQSLSCYAGWHGRRMPKGSSSKSTAAIQRLLEERRQYEAWIARLDQAADATPSGVRTRVKADYEARLLAVSEELKSHAEAELQRRRPVSRPDAQVPGVWSDELADGVVLRAVRGRARGDVGPTSAFSPPPRGALCAARRCSCGSTPDAPRDRARAPLRAAPAGRPPRTWRRVLASRRCAALSAGRGCEWHARGPAASLSWRT